MSKTTNAIQIRVSEQVVKFKPGGPPACFDVTIANQSDRFASFQLELDAHGADPDLAADWYNLSPEVSAKKPPGDRTQFRVAITDAPVPGFVGTMNLTVRIFSLELRQEERQILRLILEPGKGTIPLKVELPARQFSVHPRDRVEIPVHLYNPGQLPADVTLSFTGIDPTWLPEGSDRVLRVSPGGRAEANFLCQIPAAAQALSRVYAFSVVAVQANGPTTTAEGAIDIVPTGFVEFICTPTQQSLPADRGWLPSLANTTRYQLEFVNESNLAQQVTVEVLPGEDQPKCSLDVVPDRSELNLGDTTALELQVSQRRPWVGLVKKCLFEVKAIVSDPRLDVRNDTQFLRLRIYPVIPLWLQGLGALGLLWLVWWLSWLNPDNPLWGHKAAVNSVQLNGTADRLISGSDDQSVLGWTVEGFFNPIVNQNAGTLAKMDKAVRVVRYRPTNNDRIAAGLENGEIQFWSAIAADSRQPLYSFMNQKDDRVLDLAFSTDSRTLFSSHGSGLVLQWDLDRDPNSLSGNTLRPLRQQKLDFAAYALTPIGDGQTLAIAGRFNKLVFWQLPSNKIRPIAYRPGSKDDYILSLATADRRPNLLALSDNQGQITLLDTQQCTQKGDCTVLDQWRGSDQATPIHSVALSPNGCYLVSGGDDGKTHLWPLTPEGTRSPEFQNGKVLETTPTKLRSVAIQQVNDRLTIATGGADSEVRLQRLSAFNKSCQ